MASGMLRKMVTRLGSPVSYALSLDNQPLWLLQRIGAPIRIEFNGAIHCIHCGRATKKSYSQGFCYPCSQNLAQCDICIVRPERCHHHLGSCREPQWGDEHCNIDHIVYLANTSGVKVGITRATQIPTRWMDQGATQALPIAKVDTRYHAGLLEVMFGQYVADKTDWRTMLRGNGEPIDLAAYRDKLLQQCATSITAYQQQWGDNAIELLQHDIVTIDYPVAKFPTKITSLNGDKQPNIEGVLQGIKGQYLLLDCGVINLRKYSGYQVKIELP